MREPNAHTVDARAAARGRTKDANTAGRARIEAALSQVHAPWDAARTERTLRGLPAARRKKRARQAIGGGLMAALVLAPALWFGLLRHGTTRPTDAQVIALQTGAGSTARAPAASMLHSQAGGRASTTAASTNDPQLLRLADGSSVALLEPQTDVAVEHVDEHLVALQLRAGRARFEVTPRTERVFRVRTAEVTVEVLGTIFEVEQRDKRTRVQVTRGRVAVLWDDRREVLGAGDEGLFPPVAEASAFLGSLARGRDSAQAATPVGARAETRTSSGAAKAKRSARAEARDERSEEQSTSWRDHAEGGDFKTAFPLLPQTDTLSTMSVADLMLAADAARLSGHPRAALPFLTRVVEAHPEDARAPLAAFTLGSVLMHQLGLPREAEAAYATARATTQSVALAQDALARQVEAASRAGDEALARRLARAYLEQYPEGRRVNAVRRFGRL